MRLPPDLPPDLRAGLDKLAVGLSRKALGALAAAQSENYRAGGGSGAITSAEDALAYAFTRMPATYAAVIAVFDALIGVNPDFTPRTMLDVGAGPGTAAFAAVRAFGELADIRLIDANARLRELAHTLMSEAHSAALRQASYRHGDAAALLAEAAAEPADLVVASYVAGELRDSALPRLAQALWAATAQVLAVVEPGTPAGYGRILRLRTELIAAGAYVVAPCPHERACPLEAPDWCHFTQRLPRSREHRQIKGAAVPFEDEKFAYVVLSRTAPARRIDARVLAPPHVTKAAVVTKLCVATGLQIETVARRDAVAYRDRKSWRWGDAVAD
jgi:ribosomal protein RSM22 (predicted rRNA methylase)